MKTLTLLTQPHKKYSMNSSGVQAKVRAHRAVNSEFCHVKYITEDNVVLLTWKKFCCSDDYRNPTMFASQLMHSQRGCTLVTDASNGFEDDIIKQGKISVKNTAVLRSGGII